MKKGLSVLSTQLNTEEFRGGAIRVDQTTWRGFLRGRSLKSLRI